MANPLRIAVHNFARSSYHPIVHDDPGAELSRLQKHYHRLADEELEILANQGYELTDIARDVLQSEIRNRGLSIAVRIEPAPGPVTDPDEEGQQDEGMSDKEAGYLIGMDLELVEATRVWARDDAQRIKNVFGSAQIPFYLGPDSVPNVDDFEGDFSRGVQIRVPRYFAERAGKAIQQLASESDESEMPEVGYRCPRCRSEEIVFDEIERQDESQPDFLSTFHWHCDSCGHHWTDETEGA